LPRGAYQSEKKKVIVKTAISCRSLSFSFYSGRHAAYGIQSRLAKLPEFIPDKRRRGGEKKEKERGEKIKKRESSPHL